MRAALATLTLVSLAVRIVPLVSSGSLVRAQEYDGGAMFAATLNLLAGHSPYVDFVFLHPPGALLLFAPAGLLAPLIGEQESLAVVRVGVVLAGAVNTLLIGLLLRRFGFGAVLVGAGMYAVWPVAASTERLVLLEPVLNLCLLAALTVLSDRTRQHAPWIAGVILAIALSVNSGRYSTC